MSRRLSPLVPSLGIAAVLVISTTLQGGCLQTRQIRADAAAATLPGEALLLFAVEESRPRTSTTVVLCLDGDVTRCLTTAPQRPEEAPALYAVPPGVYCLTQVVLDDDDSTGLNEMLSRKAMSCFDVAAGALNYPGHLRFEFRDSGASTLGMAHRWLRHEDAESIARTSYPNVSSHTFAAAPTVPVPVDRLTGR